MKYDLINSTIFSNFHIHGNIKIIVSKTKFLLKITSYLVSTEDDIIYKFDAYVDF